MRVTHHLSNVTQEAGPQICHHRVSIDQPLALPAKGTEGQNQKALSEQIH